MAGRPTENIPYDTKLAGAVDVYCFEHVFINSPTAKPSPEILDKAYQNQVAGGLPDIAVSQNQGRFLQVQAKIANAKNILELGTLGGYSTLFLVNATPETKVTTIEYEAMHAKVARATFEMAGVADRVQVLEGAGQEVLAKVYEEFKAGKRAELDLTFIDADKPSNWVYFDYAVKMSRPGGIIIVDNVIRRGGIADPERFGDERIAGSREVIEKAGADPRVAASVLQTVGDKSYDGMVIAVKL
jgi:predicted O-methyltransferase YrrM